MCLQSIREIFEFPEGPSIIRLVENYRDFWRPIRTKPKYILLAESHVWTSLRENNCVLLRDGDEEQYFLNSPNGFVRYVYCLAYGENDYIIDKPDYFNNKGTPAYWELFYSCVNDIREQIDNSIDSKNIFKEILKGGTTDFNTRSNNKMNLLYKMKKKGIWLVDSSYVGINRLNNKTKIEIIKKCWELKTRDLLKKIKGDIKIITIGKTVHKALKDFPFYQEKLIDVVDQPFVGNRENTFRKCYEFCNDLL